MQIKADGDHIGGGYNSGGRAGLAVIRIVTGSIHQLPMVACPSTLEQDTEPKTLGIMHGSQNVCVSAWVLRHYDMCSIFQQH